MSPGCADQSSKDRIQPSVRVERPAQKPPMSRRERQQAFHDAYAEGMAYVAQREYGVALGSFEKAAALNPMSTEALFNLGACHEALGDPLRAIGIYRKIIELTPDDPDCYTNLGTSYVKMYHREKSPTWRRMALEAWDHSLRLKPNQPHVKRFIQQTASIE
jgi:tetratricopeptide (TPR) repeat protein